MKEKTPEKALIVEGGAMRGIFAAGVLDDFIENDFYPFDFCMGISAGSTALAGYLAGQVKRTYRVITDYSCRPQFINIGKYLRGGHFLDLDWLWPITLRELPLDTSKMVSRGIPFYLGATDIDALKITWFIGDEENIADVMKASCAVPVIYRGYIEIDGKRYTDGGVVDSIPVVEAYNRGAREITVILSRPPSYRKSPSKLQAITRCLTRREPGLAEALLNRYENYNASLDFIESPPSGCSIKAIYPPEDFPVGRLTKKAASLEKGYGAGLVAGREYRLSIKGIPE